MVVYYSTHSTPFPFTDFISTEILDRENYTIEEIQEWFNKYNFNMESKYVWVSPNPNIAARYNVEVKDWNNLEKIKEYTDDLYKYTDPKQGFIVPESDDGDEGFIFVMNDSTPIHEDNKKVFGKVAFGDEKTGATFYGKDKTIETDTEKEFEFFNDLTDYFSEDSDLFLNGLDIKELKKHYPEVFVIDPSIKTVYRGIWNIDWVAVFNKYNIIFDMLVTINKIQFIKTKPITLNNHRSISGWTTSDKMAIQFMEISNNNESNIYAIGLEASINNTGEFFVNTKFSNFVKYVLNAEEGSSNLSNSYKENEILYYGDFINCSLLFSYQGLKGIYNKKYFKGIYEDELCPQLRPLIMDAGFEKFFKE